MPDLACETQLFLLGLAGIFLLVTMILGEIRLMRAKRQLRRLREQTGRREAM